MSAILQLQELQRLQIYLNLTCIPNPLNRMKDISQKILVVDDDLVFCRVVKRLFETQGFEVLISSNLECAKEHLDHSIDLILLDQNLPDGEGDKYLFDIKEKFPSTPVLMISSEYPPDLVIRCVKAGAEYFFPKDSKPEELLNKVLEITSKVSSDNTKEKMPLVVNNSPSTSSLVANLKKVAPLNSTVLLTGESGTGKSVFSRLLHDCSPRSDKPFVAINCAAIPPDLIEAELFGYEKGSFTGATRNRAGHFEAADGGTLFLDEIGELKYEVQSKLLLFLQDRTVTRIGSSEPKTLDVRIVAATNRDLEKMVAQSFFRADLRFRLNVLSFEVPPLRERPEMILPIAERKLRQLNQVWSRQYSMTPEVRQYLTQQNWPGNIRELENCIERAAALAESDTITLSDFQLRLNIEVGTEPESPAVKPANHVDPLREAEKAAISRALETSWGHRAKAAKMLGISERTIYDKIKKYSLHEVGRTKIESQTIRKSDS